MLRVVPERLKHGLDWAASALSPITDRYENETTIGGINGDQEVVSRQSG